MILELLTENRLPDIWMPSAEPRDLGIRYEIAISGCGLKISPSLFGQATPFALTQGAASQHARGLRTHPELIGSIKSRPFQADELRKIGRVINSPGHRINVGAFLQLGIRQITC